MNASADTDQVDAALATSQATVAAVPKTGVHPQGWKYATLDDYMGAIGPVLNTNGLILIAETHSVIPSSRVTKSGDPQYGCYLELVMRVIHTASGQWREIRCVGEGQAGDDKGAPKAITGARRYAMALLFNLSTVEDHGGGTVGQPVVDGAPSPHESYGPVDNGPPAGFP